MMTRQAALALVLAAAALQNSDGFTVGTSSTYGRPTAMRPLHESAETSVASAETSVAAEPIMDIPPAPTDVDAEVMAASMLDGQRVNSTAATAAAARRSPQSPPAYKFKREAGDGKKKKGPKHTVGIVSPIVELGKAVLGEGDLNKLRGKIIGYHSDIIKSFVATSDSAFGRAVLRQLFNIVDADNSGYLDKEEVATALSYLGFDWLGEKQVNKIFERADENGDYEISLDEFMEEAPKTLKVNLVKLAKKNGNDLGMLV